MSKSCQVGDPFLYRGRRMEVRSIGDNGVIVARNPETGRDVSARGELIFLANEEAWGISGLTAPKE